MKEILKRPIIFGLALLCLLGSACGDRADRTYRRGLRLARQKKYDQAVGEMRRLIQFDPESVRARNALGQIYRAQNLYTRAIEELTLAVEMSREDPLPAYNLAGLYWDLEDWGEANRYYRKAVEIEPEFSPAYYRLGAVSIRLGRAEEAEEYFREFLQAGPEDPAPGHNNLGVLLWRRGAREEAFAEFEKARRAGPRHPEILYNFGVSSLILDREDRQGVESLFEYFRLRPGARERLELKRLLEGSSLVSATEAGLFTRDDYLRQGEDYETAGQYRLAREEYRRALELDPNSADAHYRLGRIYDSFLGDRERAVSHYESYLKLRPRSSSAGRVISRLNELRPSLAAAPVSEPARELSPAPPPTPADQVPPAPEEYYREGERLAREGEFGRAADAYRRCLEADPEYPSARLGLGRALLAAGDPSGAAAALSQARELDSAAPVAKPLGRAYVLLGAGSLAAGRFEEAIGHYQRAREEGMTAEAGEGIWKAHHNYSRSLRESGDYRAAVRQLERSLELRPEVEEDYITLAGLYGDRLNDPRRARNYYQKYLELFPRGKFADRARESLRPVRPERPPATPVPRPPASPPPVRMTAVEHYNRGAVYQREGRDEQAVGEYRQAIRLRPNLYQAHYNLGIVHHRAGRTDRALEAFKEAARINPDFAPAQLSLFNLYYHHYRMKNLARPHALRYIQLAPGTPQAEEIRRGLGL